MKKFWGEIQKIMESLTFGDDEISNWVKRSRAIQTIERIPGDASTRRYYRVESEKGSFIVMKTEPFSSEENRFPFLEVAAHLDQCGIRVPKIYEKDSELGLLLLEDLGDVTLLRHLQEVGDMEVERHLFEKIIDLLVEMQVKADPKFAKKKIEAFELSFDYEKLSWEVNFTIEQFYEMHLKREIRSSDKKILKESFDRICKTLAKQPQVFTHRDFHSRNLMYSEASQDWVMIDFQDARMGPAQYDLASLLKDSYYQLEEAQVQRLLDYYIARYEALSETQIDGDRFREIFDWMAVQRNFKAIGSFASFLNRRNNATYLKYIGNTFENIRRVLLKYPEFSKLREVLFHYYYF